MDKYGGAKPVKLDLRPCRNCGRTFVPESLVKHEANCKNIQKKRKVFDTSKQRVTEDLSLKQIKAAQKKAAKPPKSNWRQKHEEFVTNIRAARGAQHAINHGGPLPPPPPPAENPDYVSCPYCNRRFNEKAAERHINFCQTQQKRLPAGKREPTAQEKARQAASKYQPPKPKVRGASQPMEPPSSGGYGGRSGYGGSGSGYGGGSGYGAPPKGGPGARAPPPGGRAGPGGPPGSRSDTGRAPAGYGSSSTAARGRAPVGGATRGRPTPASQGSYAPSTYADPGFTQNDRSANDPLRVLSGSSLKLRQHNEVRANTRKVAPQRPSVLSSTRAGTEGNGQMSSHKFSSSSSSSGKGFRGTDSGYHSSNSEIDTAVPRMRKTRPSSGTARFCRECGTMYPTGQAKFCGECGLKRANISVR